MSIPNLHPPLSGFPPSLLVCGFLLLSFGLILKAPNLKAASDYVILFAICFTPVTYFSGYYGLKEDFFNLQSTAIAIELHHAVARLYFISLIPTGILLICAMKNSGKNLLVAYFLLLTISVSLALYTGYLGGNLVFEHRVGVALQ